MKKVKKVTFRQNLLRVINEGINSTAEEEEIEWEWKQMYRTIVGCEKLYEAKWQKLVDRHNTQSGFKMDMWKENKKAMDALGKLRLQFTEAKKAILQTIKF